jgi:hypothetical protein
MKLPTYDVLLPTLFVVVIFPGVAGGWWRYFSGHADEMANSMVHGQTTASANVEEASKPGDTLLVAHPIAYQSALGANGRSITKVAATSVTLGPDAAGPSISPNKPPACDTAREWTLLP